MRLSLHRLSPVKNIFLIIEKEEDDSRFRSTNIAQCAEKVSSSSSFFYNSNSFSQTKVYPATVPLQLFLQQLLPIQKQGTSDTNRRIRSGNNTYDQCK